MAETAIAYAESGVGKTSLCVSLARWIYEEYGQTTRLVSADLGGWAPVEREGLIKAKIVSAFNITGRVNLLNDIRQLSRGLWPKIIEEDVPILDSDGVQTGTERKKVRRVKEDKAELAKVGLYFIEGCTSIADAFMKFIVQEENRTGKPIGPQKTSGMYSTEAGEQLGGNSEGHYNIVQTEMNNLFGRFSNVSEHCKLVFWTGHVGSGTLKGEGVYAPQLVGNAKNAVVPNWVGDCFHLEGVPKIVDEQGNTIQEKTVRAFYEHHKDTSDVMEGKKYLAKSRAALSNLEALKEQFPGGFIPLGIKPEEGIAEYYKWMVKESKANYASLANWKAEIDKKRKSNAT